MKLTKTQLKRIIKEEVQSQIQLQEGLHYEGLMEIMTDALREELGSWHPEAKAQALAEVQEKGFDLTEVVLSFLVGGGR